MGEGTGIENEGPALLGWLCRIDCEEWWKWTPRHPSGRSGELVR